MATRIYQKSLHRLIKIPIQNADMVACGSSQNRVVSIKSKSGEARAQSHAWRSHVSFPACGCR